MNGWLKWGGAALCAAVGLGLAVPLYVWLAADAIIERSYTLPRSLVRADSTPDAISRGKHLAAIAGCADCHSADLKGRLLTIPDFPINASNLRALTATYADEDFDRAIRRGMRPDASSLWVMPSNSYVYMHDDDVAAILGYLRSLPLEGEVTPPPEFPLSARRKIADGTVSPIAPLAMTQLPAIGLGPHYDGGRYLAMIACGSCHGGDLGGSDVAPDLNVVVRYSRVQFFQLMRRGWSANGKPLPAMTPLALARFHVLEDWEIDPLYAYLMARAHAPTMDQLSGSMR